MFSFSSNIKLQEGSIDVLTAGELLVDFICEEYDDAAEGAGYYPYFGGAPANIAMNVRRLGITAQVAAAVGQDRLGQFLTNRLANAGIAPDLVEKVAHSTSMVMLNKSQGSPSPIFYRSADYHMTLTPRLEEALAKSKVFHFSCWPVSKSPARETMERLLSLGAERGVLIGFDPNYHPLLWPAGEDGAAYVKSIIGKADIVKPSEDDAERLFGPNSPENQVRRFLDLGAKLVILTMGKNGAIASNGRETVFYPALPTEVADTTGAGDAFWSGLYAALVKGYTVHEAISSGMAVSAYKLKFTGAVAELPYLETIKSLYE